MKTHSNIFNSTIPNIDLNMIKETIKLHHNESFVEVRAIPFKAKNNYLKIGYYDSEEKLIQAVKNVNTTHNIYIGLNQRKEILTHVHELNEWIEIPSSGGKAEDIEKINKILIDLDTKRPHKKVNASDPEIELTKSNMLDLKNYLLTNGLTFTEAFSGNGFHLIVDTIDYEPTEENENKVQYFLGFLKQKFENSFFEVDSSVFDRPRIARLYGTVSKKGINTIERPWRLSKIIQNLAITKKHDVFSIFKNEIETYQKLNKKKNNKSNHKKHPDIVGLFQSEIL